MYVAEGNKIIHVFAPTGERTEAAVCDQAAKAVLMLERAGFLNDVKRRYSESAQLNYAATQLPGFRWIGAFADQNED